MSGSSIIVLVLIALSYIVSAIFQARQARQQQEEAQRAIRERRAQAQNRAKGRAGSSVPGETGRSRQEELAARRREQLEELRRRRSGGASSQPDANQGRLTQPKPQPIARRDSPSSAMGAGGEQGGLQTDTIAVSTPGTMGTGQGPAAPPQRTSRYQPSSPTSRSRTTVSPPAPGSGTSGVKRSGTPRKVTPEVLPGVKAVTATEIGAPKVPDEPADAYAQDLSPVASLIDRIRTNRMTRRAWQEAIVLKEILDKPVALRE